MGDYGDDTLVQKNKARGATGCAGGKRDAGSGKIKSYSIYFYYFTVDQIWRARARSAQKKKGILEQITGLQLALRVDYWITAGQGLRITLPP